MPTTIHTPRTVIGPYYTLALPAQPNVVDPGTANTIRITGRVLDGEGKGIGYTMLETFQPDGRGRLVTDLEGGFELVTVKPAAVDGQAPHISILMLIVSQIRPAFTRLYFGDETEANAGDPVFAQLDETQRAGVTAEPVDGGYRFDIRVASDDETPFFDTE
ncbi:MAG TPA: hypothetical protein VFG42_19550 [Baekduia sp.]|uniref:hypothetical protein n=1 Tax=Baekduia sp. TaxID=2600305 RepID=UPI002D7A2004|nr:hypothetical protein [Baekduia sp.]HET6508998.1 hypothetical protein [Baekduia sp.]